MDGILEKLDENIEDFPEAEGLDQAQMDELLEKLIEANDPRIVVLADEDNIH